MQLTIEMGAVSSKHPDIHVVVVSPSEGGNYDTKYFQKIITEAKQEKEPTDRKSTHQQCATNELRTETSDSTQGLPSSRNLDSQLSYASSTDTFGAGRSVSTTSSFYTGGVHGYQSKNMLRSSSFVKPSASSNKSPLVSRSYVDPKRARDGEVKTSSLVNEVEEESSGAVDQPSGNMFELFQTSDGREFTVYVREDGKKFYVDWEEQVRTECCTSSEYTRLVRWQHCQLHDLGSSTRALVLCPLLYSLGIVMCCPYILLFFVPAPSRNGGTFPLNGKQGESLCQWIL